MTERKWLARFLYLETVAGVPGMVAGGCCTWRVAMVGNWAAAAAAAAGERKRYTMLPLCPLRLPHYRHAAPHALSAVHG